MRSALIPVAAMLATGCPGPSVKGPAVQLTVADAVARLKTMRESLTSFRAESVMDYWLGSQRVKGTVLVMGNAGAKLRFNALSPAGGDVLADMACNGLSFQYVDRQHNCQLTGPCDRNSIASLLRVELEPDDFLHLALGTPPVLEQPAGTVTWDGEHGYQRIKLEAAGGTQTIVVDTRDGHWDVLESELVGKDGKTVWSVQNTDFTAVKDAAGAEHRLPGKTRFKSPSQNADLLVEWKERTANVTIPEDKFVISVPPGLASCGQAPPSATPGLNPTTPAFPVKTGGAKSPPETAPSPLPH